MRLHSRRGKRLCDGQKDHYRHETDNHVPSWHGRHQTQRSIEDAIALLIDNLAALQN